MVCRDWTLDISFSSVSSGVCVVCVVSRWLRNKMRYLEQRVEDFVVVLLSSRVERRERRSWMSEVLEEGVSMAWVWVIWREVLVV